jgi:hypothetical protein
MLRAVAGKVAVWVAPGSSFAAPQISKAARSGYRLSVVGFHRSSQNLAAVWGRAYLADGVVE